MSVSTEITVSDTFGPALRETLSLLDGAQKTELNNLGARASSNALRKYHRDFNDAGKWSRRGRGPSEFGEEVARGWGVSRVDESGATITNAAPHFAFKITGGTITPKRVRALTVPLIPEARDRFAKTYERVTGKKLFRPKGTNILAEKTEGGKGFRAVYALVKKTKHKAWRGAMPDSRVYAEPFVQAVSKRISEALSA